MITFHLPQWLDGLLFPVTLSRSQAWLILNRKHRRYAGIINAERVNRWQNI